MLDWQAATLVQMQMIRASCELRIGLIELTRSMIETLPFDERRLRLQEMNEASREQAERDLERAEAALEQGMARAFGRTLAEIDDLPGLS